METTTTGLVRGVAKYKFMRKHKFKRGSGCPFFKANCNPLQSGDILKSK